MNLFVYCGKQHLIPLESRWEIVIPTRVFKILVPGNHTVHSRFLLCSFFTCRWLHKLSLTKKSTSRPAWLLRLISHFVEFWEESLFFNVTNTNTVVIIIIIIDTLIMILLIIQIAIRNRKESFWKLRKKVNRWNRYNYQVTSWWLSTCGASYV